MTDVILNPKAEKPATATKPIKSPKQRGRKGNNVATAFCAIPPTAVSLEAFSLQYNVSMHVLRQAKRFDTSGTTGKVRCKKDKETGTLMIWREADK